MGLLSLVSSGLYFDALHSAGDPDGIALAGAGRLDKSLHSLGDAFARVPIASGLNPKIALRVIVLGRERELRADVRENLYRIGREAIINAYHHSGTNDIEAEIEYRPSELRISVRDNGRGIDAESLKQSGNWGFQGMRARSERIGARLRILSRVGFGTEIALDVPNRLAFEPA